MASMLNDSQLAAVNDVTDLLPHAGLDRGTWDVIKYFTWRRSERRRLCFHAQGDA